MPPVTSGPGLSRLRTNVESTVAEWRDAARRGTVERQRNRLRRTDQAARRDSAPAHHAP